MSKKGHTNNKMGRVPILDDKMLRVIEHMALVQCTYREIANAVGVHEDTLKKSNTYSSLIEKGRENGKARLRTAMFRSAMKGNVVMQIFLSKQMLGYSDKHVVDTNNRVSLQLNYKLPEKTNNNNNAIEAEYSKNEET
jgi:hypothetical protein